MRGADDAAGADAGRPRRCAAVALTLALTLALAVGCHRAANPPALPPAEATGVAAPAQPPEPTGETFLPPATLAELDRQTTWVDRPVRDPVALAREHDALDAPACSVAEALALPNDSPEANARMLAALTRQHDPGSPAAAARVVRHLVTDVESLNPIRAETGPEFEIAALTSVDLFGFDRRLEPFANTDTVRSWQSSADGLVDKVVLRDDLTWSDGVTLTARDVAFTWRLIRDPRVPATAFRGNAERIRAVHAYDDRTVVFFHVQPLATAAADIDMPVLPRHVYARTWERDPTLTEIPEHAARETRPVTGGPYEVSARTTGREIVLRRRAGWSTVRGRTVRAPAPFAEIRFRVVEDPAAALEALVAGDLDEAALGPDEWATGTVDEAFAARAIRLITPEWRSFQVAWNLHASPFSDRRVRRAMGYAIDHGRLLDTVCHGLATPATGIFPPGSWMTATRRLEPYRQDLDNAEALLDEAGWSDHDGDGVRDKLIDGRPTPFEFTLLCDRRAFRVAVGACVQECLARIGVTCVVRPVDPEVLRDRLRVGQFEASLVAWGAGFDPDGAESLWTSAGARNYCGYANPEVDSLFAEGRRERDRGRRAERYARIQEILAEDQPCTWLFWQNEFRGISKRLAGDMVSLRGAVRWSPGLSSIWKPTLE